MATGGERYADLAVTSLFEYVQANFTAQLRLLETAQGLSVGDMPDPVSYEDADLPDDGRSPSVEVFCEGGTPEDNRNAIFRYDCVIYLAYSSDADLPTAQKIMRRYATAFVDLVRNDRTLGGLVAQAIEGSLSLHVDRGDASQARHALSLDVEVTIHEPASSV